MNNNKFWGKYQQAFNLCETLHDCPKGRLSEEKIRALPASPRFMQKHTAQAIGADLKMKAACPTCRVVWGYREVKVPPPYYHRVCWPGSCAEYPSAIRCHTLYPRLTVGLEEEEGEAEREE